MCYRSNDASAYDLFCYVLYIVRCQAAASAAVWSLPQESGRIPKAYIGWCHSKIQVTELTPSRSTLILSGTMPMACAQHGIWGDASTSVKSQRVVSPKYTSWSKPSHACSLLREYPDNQTWLVGWALQYRRMYAFPFDCGRLFYHNCNGGTKFDCRDIREAGCVGWLTSTGIFGGHYTLAFHGSGSIPSYAMLCTGHRHSAWED